MTTTWVLEIINTERPGDVRYRAHTRSRAKAEKFMAKVPRIQFSDSGHGLVPSACVVTGKRMPAINILAEHVQKAMAS